MNRNIFRKYDIRGVVDKELTDSVVEKIGKSLGTLMKSEEVAVGWDVRKSSPKIRDILVDALLSTGKRVYLIGMVPTPLLYFAVKVKGIKNGIMITASHNPPEYNGFKIMIEKEGVFGEGVQKIYEVAMEGRFVEGRGSVEELKLEDDYISFIKERVHIKRGVKVCFDPGNGATGPILERLISEFPIESIVINEEPDGSFPSHIPDPTVPEYMKDLGGVVVETHSELGIGFDGDGDRIGVVNEKGELVFGDKLLAIFAKDLLSRHPGAEIIIDVKSSQGVVEFIESLGGKVYMFKTGHSLIKAELNRRGGLLAGEMSGHIFFAENFPGYDDALYASLKFIQILTESNLKVSEMVAEIPFYYSTPEIRIKCPDEEKFKVVEKVKEFFKKKYKVIDIDGARVITPEGWGLVRASNTQPVLVLRFESKKKEYMEKLEKEFKEVLEKLGVKWEKE